MKKCNSCENQIHEQASFCPYCMSSQIEKQTKSDKTTSADKRIYIVLIPLIMCILFITYTAFHGKNLSHNKSYSVSTENSETSLISNETDGNIFTSYNNIQTDTIQITSEYKADTSKSETLTDNIYEQKNSEPAFHETEKHISNEALHEENYVNNENYNSVYETQDKALQENPQIETETYLITDYIEQPSETYEYYIGDYITEGKEYGQICGYGGYDDLGGTVLTIEWFDNTSIGFSIVYYSESGYASDTISARNITAEIIDNTADFRFNDMLDGKGIGRLNFENGNIYIETWADTSANSQTSIIISEYLVYSN